MTSVDGRPSFEELLQAEARKVVETMRSTIADPRNQQLVAEMASDLALLPLRAARGEDVLPLIAALNAEAQNRALGLRVLAEAAAQRAWIAVLTGMLGRVLTA